MDGQEYSHFLKVLVVGDAGVGKSCIIDRFVNNAFSLDRRARGLDFALRLLPLGPLTAKLQIWDVADGALTFQSEGALAYLAKGVLLVFDVSDPLSLASALGWAERFRAGGQPSPPLLLVANKSDLPPSRRVVSAEQVREAARAHSLQCVETSALDGSGVQRAFSTVARASIGADSWPLRRDFVLFLCGSLHFAPRLRLLVACAGAGPGCSRAARRGSCPSSPAPPAPPAADCSGGCWPPPGSPLRERRRRSGGAPCAPWAARTCARSSSDTRTADPTRGRALAS